MVTAVFLCVHWVLCGCCRQILAGPIVFDGAPRRTSTTLRGRGLHVETTVDLDRGVVIAEFFSEPDMEPTGETVEISLDDAGFTELIDYTAADPGWEPLIKPLLQAMTMVPIASVSRGLA